MRTEAVNRERRRVVTEGARPVRLDAELVDAPRATASLARWLTAVLAMLCVAGLVMVGSASSVVSIVYYGSTWAIVFRECLWLVVGMGAFLVASGLSTKRLRKIATLGVIASAVLLVVLVPGSSTSSFGASRWIGFGLLRIQPSELAKLALCLYLAHVITKKERVETQWGRVLRPAAIVTVVCVKLAVSVSVPVAGAWKLVQVVVFWVLQLPPVQLVKW